MTNENGRYFSDLSNKKLSIESVEPILAQMNKIIKLEDIPPAVICGGEYGPKVTEQLTRLDLSIVVGSES